MQRKGVSPVLAKLSGECGPTGQIPPRGMGRRISSDHAQLAVPAGKPNHHVRTESKAERERKVFLALGLQTYGSGLVTIWRKAGRSAPCLSPFLMGSREEGMRSSAGNPAERTVNDAIWSLIRCLPGPTGRK